MTRIRTMHLYAGSVESSARPPCSAEQHSQHVQDRNVVQTYGRNGEWWGHCPDCYERLQLGAPPIGAETRALLQRLRRRARAMLRGRK